MVANDDTTRTRRDEASDTLLDGSGPPAGFSGDRIGRYEVLAELGRGGMGVVYRARDPELDRPLAIKVVVPIRGRSRSRQKLLDEARAMAKLRHPAVVPVFDVGTTDDGIYIVMPLLAGGTMAEWAKTKRPWREVVARYVTAGRGLAAAHAAGLVHRDFKPRNVLLGDAGEVMVADFGLAATAIDSVEDAAAPPSSPVVTSIEGTPAYMAPEQAAGQAVDARADQYSFCISLWEAVHGQRPGDAATRSGTMLPSAVIPTIPADRKGAPSWLLAAVSRGFSTTPSLRWPSMASLLDHIERRQRRPLLLGLGAAALVIAGSAAAAVAVVTAKPAADPCPDPTARIAAAWNPTTQATVERVFAATNLPYAADTFERVAAQLDAYAASWRTRHIEVCRAGRVTHTQSTELLDQRMACFERSLSSLTAFTRMLPSTTPENLRDAAVSAGRLPAVEDCLDAGLVNSVPLPSAPAERERIKALDLRIAAALGRLLRTDPADALKESSPLLAEARALGYPPVLAHALWLELEARRVSTVASDQMAHELADVAAAARNDVMLARAWNRLLRELARQGRFAEASALEATARTATTRAGAQPSAVYDLERSLGEAALARSDYAGAESHLRAALVPIHEPGERRPVVVILANSLLQLRRIPEAVATAEEALELTRVIYGERHPEMANIVGTLAQILTMSGNPDNLPRARQLYQQAIDVNIGAFGDEHVSVAASTAALAMLELALDRDAEAERLMRRVIAIIEKHPDDVRSGTYLQRMAAALMEQGKYDEARPYLDRSLAHLERMFGKDGLKYVESSVNVAARLLELKDYKGARELATHAAAVFEAKGIKPGLAVALRTIGQSDLRSGNLLGFQRALQRAIEICSQPGCSPGNLEAFQDELGRVLVERKLDREQGLALVRAARDGSAKLGRDADVKELDAWLEKHGPRGR